MIWKISISDQAHFSFASEWRGFPPEGGSAGLQECLLLFGFGGWLIVNDDYHYTYNRGGDSNLLIGIEAMGLDHLLRCYPQLLLNKNQTEL